MPADRNGAFCADPGTPSRGRGQGAGAESSPLGRRGPRRLLWDGPWGPCNLEACRPGAAREPTCAGTARAGHPRGGGEGHPRGQDGAPRGEETRCCPRRGLIKGKLRGHLGKRQTRPSKAWRPAHSLAGGTPSHRRPPRCGLFQRQTLAEEGAFTKTGRLSLEKAVVRVYLFLFFKELFKNIQLN